MYDLKLGCDYCEGSAPTITEAPVNMTVVAGDSVRFECIATGAPSPSVSWSRGESQLILYHVEFSRSCDEKQISVCTCCAV